MTEKFDIVAIGGEEFTLGFRLAGIRTIETISPKEDFERLISDREIGIIITDENILQRLPEHFREDVEGKVKPVTVALSTTAAAQETLRKKIIKSIGVDLWSK
ncbi:MAG: V-type ATP synthase subunit F [Candidatus Woesearchaeota archaeon]